ncbi:MAG: imidazole glycerol phosphate synthase subunit HisH [Anaerolineaceae bacterium]|nr:MAG: imidazole glycerol phosphate synthase subunit HisH [Anaerolineaceae bacterium]
MLAVIDYGAGNLRSVLHALKHLGVTQMRLATSPDDLKDATQIILPGVGAFGAGMAQLQKQKLITPLQDKIRAGVPYLGICLGMQFLFAHSDEMGHHEGLGILPGYVTRFPAHHSLKVPHMGWNQLRFNRQSPLLDGIAEGSYAYFVHSYFCMPRNDSDLLIYSDYGMQFSAGVERGHIFGVQFHPEKSQQVGLKMLANFLKIGQEVVA